MNLVGGEILLAVISNRDHEIASPRVRYRVPGHMVAWGAASGQNTRQDRNPAFTLIREDCGRTGELID